MAKIHQNFWITARDLKIVDGNDPQHWTWHYDHLIRQEVATLKSDTVLDIVGKIDPEEVTPDFVAFLVFKLKEPRENIDEVKAYVGPAGTHSKGHIVSLVTDAKPGPDGWYWVKLGNHSAPGVLEPGQLEARVSGLEKVKRKSGLIVRAIQVTPIIGN